MTTTKKNTIGFFARKNDVSASPVKHDSDSDSSDGDEVSKPQASSTKPSSKPNSSFTALKGRLKTINFSQKTFSRDHPQKIAFPIHIASKSNSSLMKDNEQPELISSPKTKVSLQKNISLNIYKKGEAVTFSKKLLITPKTGNLIQQNPTVA